MNELKTPNPKDWLDVEWDARSLAIADPYLVWASVVRGEGVRPVRVAKQRDDWVQVLVEYKYEDAKGHEERAYTTRSWTPDYLTNAIKNSWMPLDPQGLKASITRIELSTAFDMPNQPADEVAAVYDSRQRSGRRCGGAVLAIIDFGCPLLHAAYISPNATGQPRIKYLWDQGAVRRGGRQSSGGAGDGIVVDVDESISTMISGELAQSGTQNGAPFSPDLVRRAVARYRNSNNGISSFGSQRPAEIVEYTLSLRQTATGYSIAGKIAVRPRTRRSARYWHRPERPLSRRDHQIDRRFAYGRELRPTAINEFVADTITMPVPDRYKSIRHDIDGATSHGAHMLSVAAGWPDLLADAPNLNRDAAAEADIVFVQLPARTVADTNGNSLGAHVFSALQYIASRTALSAKVVANLSYGSYAGPHDGSSLIEKAINKFVHDENAVRKGANGSFDLVIAAGNGYQSASHARVKLTNTKPSVNVPFRVMPDDTTWTFIEVWYRQSSGVTVAVQPPGSSKASSAVGPNSVQRFGDSNEPTCVIVHAANASSIGEIVNSMALVAIAPTRRLSGTKKAEAPYGVWQLVLNYDGRGEVQVDAWIERDEPILEPTFPKRQATFVVDAQPFAQRDDDYPRISHATKEATVNSIATGYANNRNVHIVGATVASSGHFSDYSPAGDITPGKCPAPSALAEADENDVLYGRLVYGNYDSVVVRRSGTSIAAAMHSRKLLNDRASGGSAARAARPPASPPSSLAATTSPLAPARGGKAHDAQ